MTTRIGNQPRNQDASRLREFTRQERESGTHPAIDALRSRPKQRGEENRKAVEYARIERGRTS